MKVGLEDVLVRAGEEESCRQVDDERLRGLEAALTRSKQKASAAISKTTNTLEEMDLLTSSSPASGKQGAGKIANEGGAPEQQTQGSEISTPGASGPDAEVPPVAPVGFRTALYQVGLQMMQSLAVSCLLLVVLWYLGWKERGGLGVLGSFNLVWICWAVTSMGHVGGVPANEFLTVVVPCHLVMYPPDPAQAQAHLPRYTWCPRVTMHGFWTSLSN